MFRAKGPFGLLASAINIHGPLIRGESGGRGPRPSAFSGLRPEMPCARAEFGRPRSGLVLFGFVLVLVWFGLSSLCFVRVGAGFYGSRV